MSDLSEKLRSSMDEKRTPDERSVDNGSLDKCQEDGVSHILAPEQGSVTAAAGEKEDVEAQVPEAHAISISPPPVKVPRSQRRGILGKFTILAEVEEPKNYPRRTKWFITCVIALAAAAAPLGSAIFFRMLANQSPLNYVVLILLQHLLLR